jgi:plasmid replication initiation protein
MTAKKKTGQQDLALPQTVTAPKLSMPEQEYIPARDLEIERNLQDYPVISGSVTFSGLEEEVERIRIVKSNKLIEAQSRLNYRQSKLLHACIGLINPMSRYPNGIHIKLTDDQISILCGIKKQHIKEFIDDATKAYHSIPFETPGKKPGTIDRINIAHRSIYDPELRLFEIIFHSQMEPELLQMARYTSVRLKILMRMPTRYSLHMYDLISLHYNPRSPKKTQHWRVDLRELMYTLGLLDIHGNPLKKSYTLDLPGIIKRDIIEPAIKQLSELSDFNVIASYHKTRRRITAVTFSITPQDCTFGEEPPSLKESSTDHGIPKRLLNQWRKKHGDDVVSQNLEYMEERMLKGKTRIDNPAAYMATLLESNAAALPDVANPFSNQNKKTPGKSKFVENFITPEWWNFSEEFRDYLVEHGLDNVITGEDLDLFTGMYKRFGQDKSLALMDPEATRASWMEKWGSIDRHDR